MEEASLHAKCQKAHTGHHAECPAHTSDMSLVWFGGRSLESIMNPAHAAPLLTVELFCKSGQHQATLI
jgi:hypothetical protein